MSMPATHGGTSSELRGHRRRAVVASTVGTTIEWYDFFLYGTAAALVFPKLFFPGQSQFAGVLASFATLFVGFAARPIGAAIFGHYGDRVGRKATLDHHADADGDRRRSSSAACPGSTPSGSSRRSS